MAIDIARECGGVPIAIVTIARGLRNKGVDEWTNVIRDLKTARIQYTYDSLKSEELETTFLLLSMMGHTYDASIGDLLRCGMSLDLFQNTDTMEEAKTYAAKLIQKLKDYALLLGTSNSERFSMDNLVREVARSIALKDRHMFNVTDDFILSDWEDKYRLKNGIAVSLLDIRQLPKKLEFPRLRFFYMKPSDPFLEIPEFFFAGMPELRVLHLIEMDLLPLPTSLRFLLNLQTLCLDQCKLGDVVVIGELEKLEILSFRSSDIEMLPKEIGRLTRLRLLDLSHCSKLKVISPNVFSNLTRLEELYMGNTSIQWEDERKVIPPDAIPTLTQPEELRMGNTSIQWEVERRNTSLYELMLLHHLTTLELHVREAGLMPEDLFFKKLERYKIVIGDCNWYEKYETARTLKLKLNTSIHFKEGFLMRLKGIENLCLDEMPGIRNVLSELDRNGFPELKHLEVQNNSYFLNIVESMKSVSCDVFPLLESLFISNLINLEKICDGPLKIMDFHRLRILEVQKCDKLKNILSFSTAESLLQLQEIKVTYCKNMEEIFAIVSKEGGNNEMIDKIQVNPLRSMTLEYLPKLTSFCSRAKTPSLLQRRPSLLQRRQKAADARAKGIILEEEIDIPTLLFNENVVFPNLEALRLSAINVEKIWHNQFQAMCSWAPKLTRLIIQGCGNLRHLFSSSVVNSFVQLQYLEICECTVLEEIIVVDGLREEERVDLIFPKLIYLKINDLGSLRRFCSGNSISIEFPSLKELEIENCPELESSIFSNKVELPRLEKMIISRMDNLKTIWPNKLAYDSLWKLKSLEVNDCQKLSTVFPSFICERIFTLESLTVKSCGLVEEIFDIQGLNFEGKKSLLRELNIGYLPNLKHIWNKDPQGMLSFEKLQKVTVFLCQNLKNLFPESIARGLFGLESLEVSDSGVEEIVSKGGVVEASTGFFFPQLSSLQLHCLPELRTFYPGIYTIEGPFLKSLGLHYCDSVKVLTSDLSCYITKEGQFDIPTELPLFLIEKGFVIFEELELSGKAITMITWQDKVPESFFGFLHSLVLNDDKSTVLAFDIIQRFHNLKKLSLNHGSYKEIFSYVDAEEHVRRLPQIKHLVLNGLNELKEIWKQDSEAHLEFRNLEILEVRSCYSLSNLMPSSASFQNLKSLEVWGCEGLMNLVTSAIAKNLVQLEKLEIFDCKRLTEVVAEEGAVIEEIIFSKLKSLSLMYLQNLTSFSSRNHTFKFPILKSLVVNECPKLKIFSEGVIITPRLRKLEFNWKAIDRCWEVDLNTTIKQ